MLRTLSLIHVLIFHDIFASSWMQLCGGGADGFYSVGMWEGKVGWDYYFDILISCAFVKI